jgi:hypothetical protein
MTAVPSAGSAPGITVNVGVALMVRDPDGQLLELIRPAAG